MKALDDINRSLRLMARRVILRLIDEGGELQAAQAEGLPDETLEDVEVFRQYGLASNPLDGAEAILIALGGSQSHGVIIAVDDRRYRLKVASGEVALYDDIGQTVHLKRDGIHLESSLKVDVVAPQCNVTADETTVSGNATVAGDAIVQGNATVEGDTLAKGNVKLGGESATKFVMLADMTPSTKVKAL